MSNRVSGRTALVLGLALLACALPACDRIMPRPADQTLPHIDAVAELYVQHGLDAELRYSGNVVELLVQQPADQLRRGGSLWARVGPYIYLFTPGTRQVLANHAGVAGVRVITLVGSEEVARALLVREALNEVTWRRAHNVLGQALESGTERPSTIGRLVQFGEEHTEYEYNPRYVPPQQ